MLNAPTRLAQAIIQNAENESLIKEIEALEQSDVDTFTLYENSKLTLLMLASLKADADVVSALLKKGASTAAMDSKGWNALHYAQHNNRLENAKLLISYDPTLPFKGDNVGNTPLHAAAKNKKTLFMQCYLNTMPDCCDVNVTNNQGETPLHEAVRYNRDKTLLHDTERYLEATRLLLAKGAYADARSNANYSPYSFAQLLGPELSTLLRPFMIPSLFTFAAVTVKATYLDMINTGLEQHICAKANEVALLYNARKEDARIKAEGIKKRQADWREEQALTKEISQLKM